MLRCFLTLLTVHRRALQACVEEGKVSGLMCSYNAVNGKPSCANDWLLTTVARGEWGFDGYITSDCGAENDVFYNHHFTNTPEESVSVQGHARPRLRMVHTRLCARTHAWQRVPTLSSVLVRTHRLPTAS